MKRLLFDFALECVYWIFWCAVSGVFIFTTVFLVTKIVKLAWCGGAP